MKSVISRLSFPLLMFVLAFSVQKAEAAVIIDDFTDVQEAANGSSGPMNITGIGPGMVSRTLVSNAAGTGIGVDGGYLGVSNNMFLSGPASVSYSFESFPGTGFDLDSIADALLFTVDYVNGNIDLQIIANGGSSEYTLNNLLVGQQLISFSKFTDPKVFGTLTSLEFIFSGANGTDITLAGNIAAVPEPSVLALLFIGLLAIARAERNKAAPIAA